MKNLVLGCPEVVTHDLRTDRLNTATRSVAGAWTIAGARGTKEVIVHG